MFIEGHLYASWSTNNGNTFGGRLIPVNSVLGGVRIIDRIIDENVMNWNEKGIGKILQFVNLNEGFETIKLWERVNQKNKEI